jgi:hypothetical protein
MYSKITWSLYHRGLESTVGGELIDERREEPPLGTKILTRPALGFSSSNLSFSGLVSAEQADLSGCTWAKQCRNPLVADQAGHATPSSSLRCKCLQVAYSRLVGVQLFLQFLNLSL